MASDLSSGSTEVNELFDDEKEEGEISLEDVSSSEEGQPYKYPPRAFGQCPYCLSTKLCATWCRSLTVNKHVPRDAGLQGKENRSNQRHPPTKDRTPEPQPNTKTTAPYSTLQEKNDVDDDLVPISSDSDMELVGLGHDVASATAAAKKLERQKSRRSLLKKARKKRRKKSSSELSLSLSPSSVDLALKESIHRVEPATLKKDGVNHSKSHHHSPARKKMALSKSPPARRHRSPGLRIRTSPTLRKRTRSPKLRKSSPLRLRKQALKRASPTSSLDIQVMTSLLVPTSRGTVSKLLKKVKKLDPFSSKTNERTSLKDKLNNIMKNKVTETPPANSEEVVGNKEEKPIKEIAKEEGPAVPKDKEEEGTKEKETAKEEKENKTAKEQKEKKKEEEKEKEEKKEEEKEKEKIEEKKKEKVEEKEKEKIEEKKKEKVEEKEKERVEEKEKENEVPVQKKTEDNEDEEDLVVLREIALQTKQKKFILLRPDQIKTEPVEDPPKPVEPPQPQPQAQHRLPNFCMDDNDEDLELRMIALRSAVLKKHRTRMQCGGLKKKQQQMKIKSEIPMPRIESPFTSTFLEDFPFLAEICSPTSPLSFKKDTYGTEDMELDSDMELDAMISEPDADTGNESPYSPTDELNATVMNAAVMATPQQQIAPNLSLYSPSNPTETPVFKSFAPQQEKLPKENNALDGSILEFVTHESRPYSPTDVTIYDPDLPGVLSAKAAMLQQRVQPVPPPLLPPPPPPLEPPPMPPLSMFTPQPMMIPCPTNLLNHFCDPTMASMAPMNNFTAIHQSMNPLMMPAPTPLFAYPAPPTSTTTMCMSTSSMTVPPPQPQPPPPMESANVTSELDDFGETDLDGSPLVPIDKDSSNQVSSWPLIGEPLYLQGIPEITQSELSKVPTLMEHNLVPASILKTNPQLQKQPIKKLSPQQHEQTSERLFRNADMRPVPLNTDRTPINCSGSSIPTFKPIKLQPVLKKMVIRKAAPAFNTSLNEESWMVIEQETGEEQKEEVAKVSKSPTESKNKRRRRRRSTLARKNLKELERRRTPRREVDDRVLKEKNSKLPDTLATQTYKSSKDDEAQKKKSPKTEEKRRRASIDDDEDTLRKLLLASLEKRKKEHPEGSKTQTVAMPSTDATPPKVVEDNSRVASPVIPPSEKPVSPAATSIVKVKSTPKVASSQIPKFTAVVTTTATNLTTTVTATTTTTTIGIKRPAPASTLASLNELPPRKLVKKMSMIPASTKVVNNAKRYQNLLLQRKLAQQKGLLPATKSRFKVNNNGLQRSASPNVPSKMTTEFQRIVINLNEDTESESDVDEVRARVSPVKSRPPLAIPTTDFEKSVDQFLKNVRQQQEQQMAKNSPTASRSESPKSQPIPAVKKLILPPPVTTVAITATNVTTTKTTPSLVTTKVTVTKTTSAASSATTNTTTTSSTALISLAKEKVVASKPTLLKVRSKLDSLSSTPQAVKHLPASQQEEYRRLKLQILEREKLKLQKSKESAAISAIAQASVKKTVNTCVTAPLSKSPLTPALVSSTSTAASKPSTTITSPSIHPLTDTTTSATKPSAILTSPVAKPSTAAASPLTKPSAIVTSPVVKPSTSAISPVDKSSAITSSPLKRPLAAMTNPLAKTRELLTLNKMIPKTQLVATISPMSKLNAEKSILASKASPVTSTKIINSTASANQNSILPQTASTVFTNKLNIVAKTSTSGALRTTAQASTSNGQAAILSKINETLNNHKKQVTAVAHKVSTLRILTKDQINLKTTRIQESMPQVDNRMLLGDLNRSVENKSNSFQTEKSLNISNASDDARDISTNNMSTSLNISHSSIEEPSSSNVGKTKKSWEDYKQDINNEVQALSQLSFEEQKKILCKSEQELVKKRHIVLDDISEMSGNLREWEFERDVQKRLSDHIKKLREELRLAEEQLQQQKEKMSAIQPRVSLYHEKINSGRKECFRLSKICNSLGQQIQGSNYEVPTAAADLLNTKIKEIAIHTQKLRNRKVQTKETIKSNNSIKTYKTGNKNKSKGLVKSKSKKSIKKEKTANSETETSVSESNSNSIAGNITMLEDNSFTDDNTANTNSENVNHINNQSDKIKFNIENSSITYENNSIELKPLSGTVVTNLNLNSVNDLNNEIINKNTNEILDTKNILKTEMEEQSIITTVKDEISSENVYENEMEVSSAQVTDSETVISIEANTILPIIPLNYVEQSNESEQISQDINSENTKKLTDPIIENSISNNTQNDNLLGKNLFSITNNKETTLLEESDQLKNENSLINAPVENSILIQSNLENEKVQQNVTIENDFEKSSENSFTKTDLVTENNICIESVNAPVSEINQNNTNLPLENITNNEFNNSSMEIDAENENCNQENVEMEVDIMANDPRITNTIIELESVENNKQDESTEVLNVNCEGENTIEDNELDTSEICADTGHSTFMEEIALLEMANETEVPDTIIYKVKSAAKIEELNPCIAKEDSPIKEQEISRKGAVQPYESILKHLQVPRNNKIDGILCPYELMGTCNDGDCQFIHQSTSHCR